jgi:hypothetical protein
MLSSMYQLGYTDMNHMPYDLGAVTGNRFLNAVAPQLTTKTLCGSRVNSHAALYDQRIQCPRCRAAIQAKITDTHELISLLAPGDPIIPVSLANIKQLEAMLNV